MEKERNFFLFMIISLGLIFAASNVYGQDIKSQGSPRLDVFYTNNVEGYLEPCG